MKKILLLLMLAPMLTFAQSIDSKYTITITSVDYELINIQSDDFEYYQFWFFKRNSTTNYITLIEIVEFNQREIDFDFIAYPEENVYYYVKVIAIRNNYTLNSTYNIKSYVY